MIGAFRIAHTGEYHFYREQMSFVVDNGRGMEDR